VGGLYELYSVPVAGPAAAGVKINHPLRFEVQICMPGEDKYADDILSFKISPDSSRVIYRAKRYLDCDHVYELFSVPIAGPVDDVVQLSGTMVTGGDLSEYEVSADSSRVVYQADQHTDNVSELYSVPVGGPAGAGVKLNKPMATGGDVSTFSISGDSSRVVYRADQDTNGLYELYSVPISGPAGSGIKLTAPEVFGGTSLHVNNFSLSPDGAWALYHAKLDDAPCWELYSVPAAGPAAQGVKLNGPLPTGAYGVVMEIRISPDSSRVVYHADQDTALQLDLYSVPIGGPATAAVKLNRPPVAGGAISWWSYQISPDGSRVAYLADQDTDNVTELYSVPLAGPASAGVKLNGHLVDGGDVAGFAFSPAGSRVVYAADQDRDDVIELYVTGMDYALYLPLGLRSHP
jgi:Tol biopolymer transport system component